MKSIYLDSKQCGNLLYFVNSSTKNSLKEYHPKKYNLYNFGCACSSKMYSGFTNKFTNRRYLLLSIIDQQNAVLHVCIEEINMLPQHMFKQFPRGAFLCILFIYLDTSLNYGIVMDHYNIVL